MVELIPKVTVSQLAPIVLYSRIIRFQSRSLAIIYSEFSVLALYAVLLFIATCCSLSPTPRQIAPILFYFALFLSFAVFHFARCFAFLLRSFLLCFGITSLYFSLLTRPALFRFVAFSRLFSLRIFDIASFTASLSLSFSSFLPLSPSTSLHQLQCLSPFSGLCSRFVPPYFALSCIFFSPFFASLSLLASAYCRTSLNFLCALLQLCFTLLCPPRYFNPFYIVFWYYLNTTHRNAIHTRNLASFRSALLRFALPRISLSFFLFPSLISPRSSLLYSALFLFVFFSSRNIAHSSVFLLALLCSAVSRHSLSPSPSVLTSPCSSALLCLA